MVLRIFSRIPGPLVALACCALVAFEDPLVPLKDVWADFCELYQRLQASHYDLFARRDKAAYDRLHARMLAGFRHPLRRSQLLDAFSSSWPSAASPTPGWTNRTRLSKPTGQTEDGLFPCS